MLDMICFMKHPTGAGKSLNAKQITRNPIPILLNAQKPSQKKKIYMKINNTKFVDTVTNHIIIFKTVIYPKALVSIPGTGKRFFSPQNIQTSCESHSVSYLKGV